MDMDWTEHLPYYVVAPALSAVLLTMAYQLLFEVNFTHKAVPPKKGTSNELLVLERTLRDQVAMGYSLFLSNALFLALVLFLQLYLFRSFDRRLNFCLSTLLAAGLVYWIAQANEKTVVQRKTKQK
eukprot:GGOE01055525.1.p1 GENE.GGOE01055525.1~~GGOE01055525.1.p1  ORF type:complete len:126 (+),score=39.61 GGOE01055525.1:246-623(+)